MKRREKIFSVMKKAREKSVSKKRLPPLTRAEMSKWRDPFGRAVSIDARAIAQQKTETETEKQKRFVVVRYSDGKAWTGPWTNNGKLFSSVERKWFYFKSEADAEQAAARENFDYRVDVFEM